MKHYEHLGWVAPDCELEEGVKVWQYASVLRGARIGRYTTVGSCAVVDCAKVGPFCSIGHGAQIHPGVVLENEVFVGPGAILCNDRWPRVSKVDFDINKLLVERKTVIRVQTRASIGAGAIVLPGVVIGIGAMVAAGARVTKSVPDYHMVKGSGEVVEIDRRQTFRLRVIE